MGNKLNRQEHKTHHTQRGRRRRRCRFLQKTKEKAPWERTETQTERRTIAALVAAFLLASRSQALGGKLPDRSCLMRPLLLLVLTGRKSLNQEMSGSGLPLAAQSMVAVRVRSTTLSWGPISMVGKPGGSWSSETQEHQHCYIHTHTSVRWSCCRNLEKLSEERHTHTLWPF